MKLEKNEILQKMIDEFRQEYICLQNKISSNSLKIQESYAYLKTVQNVGEDVSIFSPRSLTPVFQEEIKKIQLEIRERNVENDNLTIFGERLLARVDALESMLKKDKEFNAKLFQIQEEERYRISRDLHDTSLQNLVHLIHKIELSSMYIDKDPIQAKLELSLIRKNLKSTIEEIRNTIFNLRPMEFDDLGLKAAFERTVERINIEKKYKIDFEVEDVSCENTTILFSMYRIIQECLNNIKKHACATEIIFHAKCNDDKYNIMIQYNGKGFTQKDVDEKKDHFGITLMKERIDILKGTINFISNSKGTKILIEIPMKENLMIR